MSNAIYCLISFVSVFI